MGDGVGTNHSTEEEMGDGVGTSHSTEEEMGDGVGTSTDTTGLSHSTALTGVMVYCLMA